jgi:hypothetical protein
MAGADSVKHPGLRALFLPVISICDKVGRPVEDFEIEFREIGSYIKSAEWKSHEAS